MLNRVDPLNESKISTELKEAVAESILTNLHNTVSGANEQGKIVSGVRPSIKYVSGFIDTVAMARNSGSSLDESANPIHITTIGMDIQAIRKSNAQLMVTPSFSLYVRALPTIDELIQYKTRIDLTTEVKNKIKEKVKETMLAYDKEHDELKTSDRTQFNLNRKLHRKKVVSKLLKEQLGITLSNNTIADGSAENSEANQVNVKLLKEGETENEVVLNSADNQSLDPDSDFSLYAVPGMSESIPSSIIKKITPRQRWIRIDFHDIKPIPIELNSPELDNYLDSISTTLNMDIQERFNEWLNSEDVNTGGKLWAFPKKLTVTAQDIKNWDNFLVQLRNEVHAKNDPSLFPLPQIKLKLVVDTTVSPDNSDINLVRIAIENQTDTDNWRSDEYEESVFQATLKVDMDTSLHQAIKLDRIKPSYQYLRYLNYPALGYNSGIASKIDGKKISLSTTWMPVYRQPRIRPIDYEDINVKFSYLQSYEGIKGLALIPERFDEWIQITKNSITPSEGSATDEQRVEEEKRFKRDLKSWQNESDRIRAGVNLLMESFERYLTNPECVESSVFKAWIYMNETMEETAKSKKFDSWRLFQIAFILANISGLASRIDALSSYYDPDWDESVALLYFATGGGKTESFFGLLVFNLFLDRLRGKHNGVTAMIRYPLRLLTIQQAQRLSKTLSKAEEVRWKHEVNGQPFSIGFWVGGSNTPNRRADITKNQVPVFKGVNNPSEASLNSSSEYQDAMDSWNKLPDCPFCGGKTALRQYPNKNGQIGHACLNDPANCSWNNKHGGSMVEPLPFYIVDEDIYDVAPSVLLGTIDKLALIGHYPTTMRRILGMFGLAPLQNKTNKLLTAVNDVKKLATPADTKLFPFYDEGETYFHDPFPSLIIQDEAHLLEESLGTFSGIFETAFENMLITLGCQKKMGRIVAKAPDLGQPRMPKIIAASATVTEPEKQMEGLYQRKVAQFPHPGPELYYSFYSEPLKTNNPDRQKIQDIEIQSHTARFYASMLTNGRPHTSVSVEILGNFHLQITELLIQLNSEDASEREKARLFIKSGVRNSDLSTIYQAAIDKGSDEALATLVDLHRIALTYVTNKKGGDQIMAAENDVTTRIHEDAGIEDFDGLYTELISGSVSAGQIEKVIQKAELRPNHGMPFESIINGQPLRSVVATSAISHGVDVNEFNTMFFAGMPSNPSEYIQSSSRVGRTHVGLSILIPTPQRRRDRYIIETHDQYHRFLERMIKPASVNRWAENALIRTIPSLLQIYFVGVQEQLAFLNAKDENKDKVHFHHRLNQILRLQNKEGRVEFLRNICHFINASVGLSHKDYSPSAREEFSNILKREIQEIVNHINDHEDLTDIMDVFKDIGRHDPRRKREPMTSLRDVDPAGVIRYEKRVKKSADSSIAREVMKIITKGGV